MKKSNRKNTIKSIMLALILITLCLFFISNTYARYSSEWNGSGDVTVAKWVVKVDNKLDTAWTASENVDFTVVANPNVVQNKIAPETEVQATVNLDLTGTQVNAEYKIEIDTSALETALGASADDLTVQVNGNNVSTSFTVVPGFDTTNGYEAADAMDLDISIVWTNNDLHNASDTAAGRLGNTISLPITLTVQQHID